MKIGYARVSTKEQNMALQIDALQSAGCEQIYKEVVSGAKTERKELNMLLNSLRKGDVVVVYKIDRLGRSLRHLLELVNLFEAKGVGFQSLNDPIDTTTSHGKLIFNIFSSLAEFERQLISERTKAGLKAARARGRKGGRPKGLSAKAKEKAKIAATLYQTGQHSIKEICGHLKISSSTLYTYLRHQGVNIGAVVESPPTRILTK